MKLFFAILCCFAIPMAARAEQVQKQKKHAVKPQHQRHVHTGTGQGRHSAKNAAQASEINGGAGQHHHDGKNDAKIGEQINAQNKPDHHAENGDKVAGEHHLSKKEIRHFDLANKPNANIESAKFQANHRIEGSEKWHGDKYVVFKNYHSEWHDHDWWHHHYDRVILISGGWYFWNAGFWYPAWGYDPAYSYYPYDGPIYATSHNLPPDQVIANVQAELQQQGYYRGEVDGLLGPLTRAALADYQQAQGLTTTAAIDEPTLDSLGLS